MLRRIFLLVAFAIMAALVPLLDRDAPDAVEVATWAPREMVADLAPPQRPTPTLKAGLGAAVREVEVQVREHEAAGVRPRPSRSSAGVAGPTGGGSGGSKLDCIKGKESGGDYGARGPGGYGGAYQFDRQTWASVGGSGDPANASPSEQDMRAQMLVAQRGYSPWPTAAGC